MSDIEDRLARIEGQLQALSDHVAVGPQADSLERKLKVGEVAQRTNRLLDGSDEVRALLRAIDQAA